MMLFAQADQGGIYSLISTLLFIAFLLILSIPDIQLGFQMWRLSSIVEKELGEIKRMSDNARNKLIDMLKSLNAKDPQGLVDTLAEMFVIDPVSVEPIDIISRMRHLLRGGESKIKSLIKDSVPNADPVTISKLEVSAEVVNALNLVYKVVRHYINLAKKLKSPMLMYQVQMVIPAPPCPSAGPGPRSPPRSTAGPRREGPRRPSQPPRTRRSPAPRGPSSPDCGPCPSPSGPDL